TVQRAQITEQQISSLFWVNIAISLGLGALIAASSSGVAWFYDKPELTEITLALVVPFVISGAQIQHLALLRRHMLFTQIAIISILSHVGAAVTAVAMAWLGYGYWALVGWMWASAIISLLATFQEAFDIR
ncbi:MAG: oligosaccharide flippase family protein, partial [Polyangiaceae bacterium]